MRSLITIKLSLIFLLATVNAQAQRIGEIGWETPEDFKEQESLVVEDILWLEENPVATGVNDTKAISEFVLAWLTANPYLSVNLDEVFLEQIVDNKKFKYGEKFRVTYLFGKAVYQIENQDNVDETRASTRGIAGMVKVYYELQKFDPSIRNRILERYAKLYEDGKLENYVETTLSKSNRAL